MARSKKSGASAEVGANPFTERGFVASAGLLGIAVLVGLLTIVTASDNGGAKADGNATEIPSATLPALPPAPACPAAAPAKGSSAPATTPATATTPTTRTTASAPANTPATAQAAPAEPGGPADIAPDTVWTYYAGLALPESPGAGPLATTGDAARCFTHSRAGALIAAAQISARFVFSSDWRTVAGYQLADAPGRDAAVRRRTQAEQSSAAQPGGTDAATAIDPQHVRQISGFQIVGYSDDTATVRIAASSPAEGILVSSTYWLVWSDGDWKLKVSDSGATALTTQRIASLTGYTPWSGNAGRP